MVAPVGTDRVLFSKKLLFIIGKIVLRKEKEKRERERERERERGVSQRLQVTVSLTAYKLKVDGEQMRCVRKPE